MVLASFLLAGASKHKLCGEPCEMADRKQRPAASESGRGRDQS